jgi:DNA polymerase-1
MARPTLFLIDGSSQMYRAYHAFRGRGLSNQEGRSTHAVYVFVTMLRKLFADHNPTHIAASFDLAGPTFRDEIVSDYKANRAQMPDDLVEQINWVHEACEAMGVPILTMTGYEADDVLGTMATRAAAAGHQVAIVSIDKDFFQLVRDNAIAVYDPREDGAWFDERAVFEKFGVKPSQVVDVLALVGDTSDNVAGVPGIGKKGAIDLITRYGSLDGLLAHTADLKPKQRETLETHREQALQSRQLVTIDTDAPIDFDVESLRYRGASRARCFELFTRLAFRTLVNEYAPTADSVETDYALVTTEETLQSLVAELRSAESFAIYLITDQPTAMRSTIVGIAVSTGDRQGRYIPIGHRGDGERTDLLASASAPTQLDAAVVLRTLKPLLEDDVIAKRGHDLKTVALVLARSGITLRGLSFDSILASYLLDANRSNHVLEEVALEHLGYRAHSEEDVRGRGVKAASFATLSPEAIRSFAAERADLAWQLSGKLAPLIVSENLAPVFRELEMPLIPVLVDIERAGVLVDGPLLASQSRHLEQELASYTARIYELAREDFNINSPMQLGRILFEKLSLPVARKTGKTRSASTAAEVLEELALVHELPRLVLDWRGLQKLKSTYIDALPLMVSPVTGRVHTTFNQAIAATGRLSSSDPNLQNIPIRSELGREIRRAFIAAPGCVLISADYSQIELRVLAHLAGEEALVEAFRTGEDIHDRTAARLFGTNHGLGRHEMRSRSKMVNYAVLYGKTPFTLAKDINVSQEAAQEFINAYFAGFPRVRAFIDRTLEEARQSGVVRTMFGRRRLMPNLTSRNFQMRSQAEREAVNMPIQGTAADILKKAMIDLHAALPSSGLRAQMILTVHDELLFECAREDADAVAAFVRERMEGAASLRVPLTVDIGIGDNWRDAKS